jgi:hypothetical protein
MRGTTVFSETLWTLFIERISSMLWTIIGILVVLWLLGVALHVGGGLIHVLLIVAGVIFLFQLITGRRAV